MASSAAQQQQQQQHEDDLHYPFSVRNLIIQADCPGCAAGDGCDVCKGTCEPIDEDGAEFHRLADLEQYLSERGAQRFPGDAGRWWDFQGCVWTIETTPEHTFILLGP